MKAETYRLSNEGIEDRHADLMAQLMDFKAEIDSRHPLVIPQPSPRSPWLIPFAIGCCVGGAVAVAAMLAAGFTPFG